MEKVSDYMLYLSGVISENQMDAQSQDQVVSSEQVQKLISKLSLKFGQKANTYKPLLVYLKNKPELLALFDDLLTNVGEMKATSFGQVTKQI